MKALRRFGAVAAVVVAVLGLWRLGRGSDAAPLTAPVTRGSLASDLTVTGTLKPVRSITYRSPVPGRELEIVWLADEGARVAAGDPLVRLDTSELERDIERQRQELRQLRLDLLAAHGERQEAEAAVQMATEGDGALSLAEAKASLQLAEKKRDRLSETYEGLRPLLARGFITRDELSRTQSDLEQAEQDLQLARKRADVVERLAQPRAQQRAEVTLAQKRAQVEAMVGRVEEAEARLTTLTGLLEGCRLVARGPGLVVYETLLSANPRRKVRVGDRVTPSQAIVTIPEVSRMTVEASVAEAEVQAVRAGQAAAVHVEAFPGLALSGRVVRVGTVAAAQPDRPLDDKRFELVIDVEETEDSLRPEMSARADIRVAEEQDTLLVPLAAVAVDAGVARVRVSDGRAFSERVVQLGASDRRFVSVRSGLREGERVVLDAPVEDAGGASVAQRGGTPASRR